MLDKTNAEIELLLAELLSQPVDDSTLKALLEQLLSQSVDDNMLESLLEQLTHRSDPQATLTYLESFLSWQDDPDWLQAIAAARDGFMMPEVEEFLEERDALTTIAPEVVAQFDTLLAISPVDEQELLPDFPTFAVQFEREKQKSLSWIQGLGYQWRRIQESGKVVIQLLNQALGTVPPASMATPFIPIAVKGDSSAQEEPTILHRIKLEPEETGEMDIEAIIRRDGKNAQNCTVTVRALIPSQWEWAGTVVKASAGDWQAEAATDDEGEVILEGMPESELEGLLIEVNP